MEQNLVCPCALSGLHILIAPGRDSLFQRHEFSAKTAARVLQERFGIMFRVPLFSEEVRRPNAEYL